MNAGIGLNIGIGVGCGGKTFTPGQLPNLLAWFKAGVGMYQDTAATTAAPLVQSTPVRCWKDLSGNNNHAIALSNSNPAFVETTAYAGKGVGIYFDGLSSLLQFLSAVVNTAHTTVFMRIFPLSLGGGTDRGIFGVGATQVNSNLLTLLWFNELQDYGVWEGITDGATVYAFNTFIGSNATPFSTHVLVYNTAVASLQDNGVTATVAPAGANSYTGVCLGGNVPNFSRFTQMYLEEIIFVDRNCTQAEMNATSAYLSNRPAVIPKIFDDTAPLLVFDGNSLTSGSGVGTESMYPVQLLVTLTNPTHYIVLSVVGYTVVQLTTLAPFRLDPLYSLTRASPQVVVIWEIINDIFHAGASAATAYADQVAYCNARKATGWKVVQLDCLPSSNFTAPMETIRQTVNANLAADFNVATGDSTIVLPHAGITYADVLVKVSTISQLSDFTNLTYYVDGTHLTVAGYALIAAKVKLALAQFGIT